MLSKRNYKERLRQMEQKTERFSIRKLTIGAASVLIGISFLGFNGHTAKAATTEGVKPNEKVVTVSTVQSADTQSNLNVTTSSVANSSAAASTEVKASQAPASQSVASSAASSSATPASSAIASSAASSASEKVASSASSSATSEKASSAVKSEDAKATASSAAKDDNVITSNSNGVVTGKNAQGTWAAKDETQGQTVAATNWNELANALNSSTVSTIDLQGDINVDNSSNATKRPNPLIDPTKLQLTDNNISREVTINGNGHTINFGDYYITQSKEGPTGVIKGNRSKNSPWDVTFNDVTINANNTNPFGFDGNTNAAPAGDAYDNQKYDKVTFKDSTVTIKKGALIDSDNVNVVFSGNNVITTQDVGESATLTANSVIVTDGTTTINNASSNKASGLTVGMNTIWVQPHDATDSKAAYDSVTIDEGATLNINADAVDQNGNVINSTIPNQSDLRGIVTSDFKTGTITVNGNLNEKMGNGHSSAILTGNLNIGSKGNVNINTKQDNEADGKENAWTNGVANYNGYHYGVIGLGVGKMASVGNGTRTLNDNGSLTIIRKDVPNNTADGNVFSGLISFGAGADNNIAPGKFTLNVGEGATLDLQDQATFQPTMAGQIVGMITMFGNAASDYVTFTKPAYVNLQRTGKQSGSLLRLEGNVNAKYDNIIQLNGVTPGGTPLSQWDTGNYTSNPSNTWRITDLTAHSANGNYAIKGFEPEKGSKSNYSTTFLNSDGSVTLVMDKLGNLTYKRDATGQVINDPQGSAAQEVQLNNFLNDFNFWTPQRISFGNKAAISQSIYEPTDVQQGTTKTVKPTVFNTPSDSPQQDQIKTTYAKTDDTPAWVSVDENTGELTLTPTADNSKVGMYNVPVLVTDTDQTNSDATTTHTVLAPVFVTDGNETVVWPKDPEGNLNGAIVITTDPSAIKAHETSDNNMDLKATDAVKSIDEYQMDTVNTISTTPTSIAKDDKGITIAWGTEPSTVVSEATKGETIKGSVNVTFDKDSQPFTDQVVDQDSAYTTTSDLNIDAPGAVAQETAPTDKVSAKAGDELTDDQFKALVNSSIPASEIDHATLQSVDKDNAVVRITFNDKDAKGQNTYLDVKVPASYITTPSTDADKYNPKYNPVNVNKGGSIETGEPTYGKGVTAPTGTTYTIPEGTKLPEGVTAKVDPNSGNVTVTTSDNTPEGPIFVPVTVNYPDGSQETIDAPIAVGSNTFIGTDYSVSVETDLDNLHETTENSMNPDAKDAITKITWWNNNDVRAGKNLDGTVIYDKANGTGNLNDVTVEWTNPINTNVDKATMDEVLPGSNTSTVDIEKNPAIKITYGANSQLIKDTGNGLFTTQGGSQTARWYGNGVTVQGADAKNPAKPVDVTAGVNELTSDQVAALINTTNLDKLTANRPVSYTWANPLKVGDKTGTVRITFEDKAADGNNTYLDVALPANSLNVTGENATGTPIVTEQGVEPNPADGIGNKDELDPNTKYTWTNGEPDVSKIGTHDVSITVTYPDGKTQTVDTPLIVTGTEIPTNPNDPSQSDLFTKVTRTINGTTPDGKKVSDQPEEVIFARTKTVDKNGDTTYGVYKVFENGAQTDKTTGSFAKVDVPQVDGYTSQVDGKDATAIPAENVTPETKSSIVNVTYKETDAHKYTPKGQDVHTNVGDTPEASEGVANRDDLPTGTGYTWKTTPDVSTPGTKDATVVVTYPDGSKDEVPVHVIVTDNTPTYSENATGTPIVTDQGVEPNPADGIGNKDKLDPKTTYSWTNGEPDVSKIGVSTVTITVHYPDGKTQDVDTPLIVTGTEIPTNPNDPSQSDLFTYVTRNINITTPDGKTTTQTQKATFARTKTVDKNGKTSYSAYTVYNTETNKLTNDAETTLPEVPVTQIDGYFSEVNGTKATKVSAISVNAESKPADVNVTYTEKGKTPTNDSDKYTPEPAPITTDKGHTPDPSEGIGNKGDLPDGTKYSWTNGDPDVNTVGTKPVTITVTYPDGSTDEVPTTITVKEPTTNPTDSDKYTPEPAPITTDKGVMPDPSEGIGNKGDLPDGTKYSWTNGDPDVNTVGTKPVTITVTYPDGSTDTVGTTITVENPTAPVIPTDADTHVPEPAPITTDKGVMPDPSQGIGNKDDMPQGTKYTWTDGEPDVNTVGTRPVTITVTYPDGSVDNVTTTITVNDSTTPAPTNDSDKYTPEPAPITTDKGHTPDPSQGIGNKDNLPDGTKYSWTNGDPDVNTVGTHDVSITVTYPDGSTDTVTTTITVTDDSDKYTPEPTPITTDKGHTPDPSEGIGNKGDLPDGTKYSWTNGDPDVNTVGTHDVSITVTYPDGSTDTVTTTITVTDGETAPVHNIDSNGNNGSGTTTDNGTAGVHETTVNTNGNGNVAHTSFYNTNNGNKNNGNADAKTLPQTGAEANMAGLLGLMIASVGAILGLAADKKRKN